MNTPTSRRSRWLLLLFATVLLRCSTPLASLPNAISANGSLSGRRTITSPGGLFSLGFFQLGKSPRFYLGIWYTRTLRKSVVWVANRDRPILDASSAELTIQNGDLVLLTSRNQAPVWSTELNSRNPSSGPLEAVLTDNGNFVLRRPSSPDPIWQSFDHLTHVWLPDSRLGVDRSGRKRIITSWKNSEDPSPGLFTMEQDPRDSRQYVVMWNRSTRYWTTGPWTGDFFPNIPKMRMHTKRRPGGVAVVDPEDPSTDYFNVTYVSNPNESYIAYHLLATTLSTFTVMDTSGQVKQQILPNAATQATLFVALPEQQCEVYDFCGSYGVCDQNLQNCDCLKGFRPRSKGDWGLNDHSGGCVRETPLKCGNVTQKKEDVFLANSSFKLPDHRQSRMAGSAAECQSSCSKNCWCMAYSYGQGRCSFWTENLLNTQKLPQGDRSGRTLYVRLAASALPLREEHKRNHVGVMVASIASGFVLLGVVLTLFWKQRWKIKLTEGSLVVFRYKDLQLATKNFSDKLGAGGFGTVFKGTLPDSAIVAVKKLESIHQGDKQFRAEVNTIGTIQHVNLVRLRGFCSKGNEKLLVYDYMPNGSLDSHLFREEESKLLGWNTRFQIALGTARGLTYLHEKCRDCIIHCDIKPENILLDADLHAKVADFGLAKLFGRDFSRVLTTIRGTRGYLAPEWISGVAITTKADVYSYGMMLFELISGRRNSEAWEPGNSKFFPYQVACNLTEGGDLLSLLDHRLEGEADSEELARSCRVACWCIQEDEAIRPSMSQVVGILEQVLDVNVPPIPRFLQLLADNHEDVVFFTRTA